MTEEKTVWRDGIGRRGSTWAFVIEGPRKAGKRHKVMKTGFKTRAEAKKARDEARASLHKRTYVEPSSQRLADYLTTWLLSLPTRAREPIAPTTAATYRHFVDAYVIPTIGHVRLQDLTAAGLDRLYRELLAHGGRSGRPLAPKTVRHVSSLLHKALADAVRKGLVARNVAADADGVAVPRRELRMWGPAEMQRFLEEVRDDRFAAGWRLFVTTGLRRSELLGLAWRAVDFDAGEIEVTQRLVLVDHVPTLMAGTKTNAGRRRVGLDPGTASALRAHKSRQTAEKMASRDVWQNTADLVFTEADGSPINPGVLSKRFARVVERSGLPRITLHGLRHSHASAALLAGIDVRVVSGRLGHASSAITRDVYQHVAKSLDREAASTVAALLEPDGSRVATGSTTTALTGRG